LWRERLLVTKQKQKKTKILNKKYNNNYCKISIYNNGKGRTEKGREREIDSPIYILLKQKQ
jgi:hypothetical protein